MPLSPPFARLLRRPALRGEVLEWPNRHAWKACRPLPGLVGSNPTLSASHFVTHTALTLLRRRRRASLANPHTALQSLISDERPLTGTFRSATKAACHIQRLVMPERRCPAT